MKDALPSRMKNEMSADNEHTRKHHGKTQSHMVSFELSLSTRELDVIFRVSVN